MVRSVFLFIVVFQAGLCSAQVSLRDSSVTLPMVQLHGAFHMPEADLAHRFGPSAGVGAGFMVKHQKGWLFGADFTHLFGNRVKAYDLLSNLVSDAGFVISSEGLAMDVFLHYRGFMAMGRGGYMFPWLRKNPNSGPIVLVGAGFWQHRIMIEQVAGFTPALDDPYRRGYDRLANGLAFSQAVGYQLVSSKRLLSFFLVAEVNQGLLQGRREYNFDDGLPGTGKRFDMSYGLRAGWSIPIYRQAADKVYYY